MPFSNTEPFHFCPADGTPLGDPRPSGGVTCPECGRSWYRNSAPAVGVAIVRDGKALVTVRAGEPEKGRVDVPGGFLEVGEHPVRRIEREVREELGVRIEVEERPVLLATHTYRPDGIWVLAISFWRVWWTASQAPQTTWPGYAGSRPKRSTTSISPGNTTADW